MPSDLAGCVALVTGASSGIGEATARRLAFLGASVALVARRQDGLDRIAAEISRAGGTALAIEADITDRPQAEAAVAAAVARFGRLDILVNNAGLMLLGPMVDADITESVRVLAINIHAITQAALPHLLAAAEGGPHRSLTSSTSARRPAGSPGTALGSITTPSSWVNGFRESLRQEITRRHVRVGVLEPGGVATELGCHNSCAAVEGIEAYRASTEVLAADDIADGVACMVTQPRHASVGERWIVPTDEV